MQYSSPSNRHVAVGSSVGVIAALGAVLSAAQLIDTTTAVSRALRVCGQFHDEIYDLCRHAVDYTTPRVPPAMVLYLLLVIAGSLTAVAGVILLFRKSPAGQYLILGGGAAMLLFAILADRYGVTIRITCDLIAGLVISIAGGLMSLPRTRRLLRSGHHGQAGPGAPR